MVSPFVLYAEPRGAFHMLPRPLSVLHDMTLSKSSA